MEYYWTLIHLTAFGNCCIKTIAEAQAFFERVFWGREGQLSSSAVQRELIQWVRHPEENPDRVLAEWCLRCYISHQIHLACQRLATRFGDRYGFSATDLLPFVLDDVPPSQNARTEYRSLADRILQTFNPDRSGLTTWIDRQVKQQPDLHRFLLEQGVYLASPWALLNDTKVTQLRRILREFYHRSDAEIDRACELLQAYHDVYRQNRLEEKVKGKGRGKCPSPTAAQLQQIAQLLEEGAEGAILPEGVADTIEIDRLLNRLKRLANNLRQYRLYLKTGRMPEQSLDSDELSQVSDDRAIDTDAEEEEFRTRYCQELRDCLDEAIASVIQMRVRAFEEKKTKQGQHRGQIKARKFLNALQLLHCNGLPMGEIARELGLKQQSAVSRLLDLKAFRTDVRHQILRLLRDRLHDLAKHYLDPNDLQTLDRRLDNVLGEHIDAILQQSEDCIRQKRPTDSLFSHRLCRYLDTRNPS